MNKQILVLAAGAALLTAAQSSFAGSAPAGSVNYQVVLEDSCVVSAFGGGPINLGSQPSYAGNKTVTGVGNVTLTCSNMAYGICVSGGSNYIAGVTRRLKDTAFPANYLVYDLQDASNNTSVGDRDCAPFISGGYTETANWAYPFGGSPVPGIPGTGGSQSFSMNAIVTIPTNSIPGVYSDNGVQLTIVW